MAAEHRQHDFWNALSLKARVVLSLGIFCTFAPIGIFVDFWSPGAPPWHGVIAQAAVSGLISLSWAYTMMWGRKFIAAIVITSLGSMVLGIWLSDAYPDSRLADLDAWQRRAAVEGVACVALITLGYVCFVKFIGSEGAEQFRLRTEVDLARGIHEVLVPPVEGRHGCVEVYGRSVASSEVGGDLLDVFEDENSVVLTVADVSGHGVAAGTLMGMVKSAARVRLMDGVKLETLVADLNRVLFQVKGEGMFATMSALRFRPDGSVEVAVAGHLPLFHIHARSGHVDVLPNEHLPLGILVDTSFWARMVRCEPGDVFVLVTDGLTEVENGSGEQMGWDRIRDLAAERRDRPLAEIHAAIMEAVTSHGPQEDDQTLVLARFA
jgi:hypothetical protein